MVFDPFVQSIFFRPVVQLVARLEHSIGSAFVFDIRWNSARKPMWSLTGLGFGRSGHLAACT